jgi:hypothetical protein
MRVVRSSQCMTVASPRVAAPHTHSPRINAVTFFIDFAARHDRIASRLPDTTNARPAWHVASFYPPTASGGFDAH